MDRGGQRPLKKCYDVKTETSEVQAERIRHQRSRGDSLAALQERRVQITVDRYLHARENDEEQGQRARRLLGDRDAAVFADGDSVRGWRIGSRSGSEESGGPQRRGKFFALCFSRSQTPSSKKGHAPSVR